LISLLSFLEIRPTNVKDKNKTKRETKELE
jgi:hypothetical protein